MKILIHIPLTLLMLHTKSGKDWNISRQDEDRNVKNSYTLHDFPCFNKPIFCTSHVISINRRLTTCSISWDQTHPETGKCLDLCARGTTYKLEHDL